MLAVFCRLTELTKFETLLKHCNWQLWNPVLQDLSKFVQQIDWDKATIFWHLSAGSEYKCMKANNMCLAALIGTLISRHVFKDCCQNLRFTSWQCVRCVLAEVESDSMSDCPVWQWQVLAVGGCSVLMCVYCSSVWGFELPPTVHQMSVKFVCAL